MISGFRTVLVANRGEIAARIVRSARALGYATVAVYSDADADALHVHAADRAVHIGPAPAAESYLSTRAILAAAASTGADAIHPGYGFLAENADFAQACLDAGLRFVGPSPEVMRVMGDKARAKQAMRAVGLACVPGWDGDAQDDASLSRAAAELGFPLLVKAVAGGGGRGMRRVDAASGLARALASARAEARAAFGDDRVLLERLLERARHVEVQVLADAHGNVIHLGERDCSLQRRHQKVVEETPSPAVDDALRARLGAAAVEAARAVGYVGAGTIELLLDDAGAYWFLEMNTRLQVEHTITEAVTGLDLVALQLRIAAGEALPLRQEDVCWRGHAVEARLCAEDPGAHFLPQSGRLLAFRAAGGDGLRCDAGVRSGDLVSPHYDPLLAKIIAHGADREQALRRLALALAQTIVLGIPTNRAWLGRLLAHPRVVDGAITTAFVEHEFVIAPEPASANLIALAAALWTEGPDEVPADPWRNSGSAEFPLELRIGEVPVSVRVDPRRDQSYRVHHEGSVSTVTLQRSHDGILARIGGIDHHAVAAWEPGRLHLQVGGEEATCEEIFHATAAPDAVLDADLLAPTAGKVTSVEIREGDRVEIGEVLLKIEAMKLEASLTCARAGVVAQVRVRPGDQVRAGQRLVVVQPDVAPTETRA